MSKISDIQELRDQRDSLMRARTILIAAKSQEDYPEMGVTPVIRHDGDFYIYPSHLASHVRAMLDQNVAQFMMIEDETSAQNIWARRRLKFTASLVDVERDSALFDLLCTQFAAEHGPTIGVIRDFSDFHMMRLVPTVGVMVLGFAKAFELRGRDLDIVAHLEKS